MMGESTHSLDPHRRPPFPIKALYKKYQRASLAAVESDQEILDLRHADCERSDGRSREFRIVDHVRSEIIETACASFGSHGIGQFRLQNEGLPCYESQTVSGTYCIIYLLLHFLTGQGFS